MVVDLIIDTTGKVSNIEYSISKDIASKFTSCNLYGIRNAIKKKIEFKSETNYHQYNYLGYAVAIKREIIVSIFKQILKNDFEDKLTDK